MIVFIVVVTKKDDGLCKNSLSKLLLYINLSKFERVTFLLQRIDLCNVNLAIVGCSARSNAEPVVVQR